MTAKDNKATARRLVNELWNNKNPAIIRELFAPDCVYRAADQELHGHKAIRAFYDTYVTAFPHLSVEIHNVIAESDRVAFTYTVRGQHTGKLRDIKPTGRQVKVRGTSFMRFKNGQIAEETNLWNTLDLMQQVGVVSEAVAGKMFAP